MQKAKKRFLGLVSLFLVVVMTIVAYYLPVPDAAAEGNSHTETIRVIVYDQYPSIKFTSPEDGHTQSNPLFKFKFDYENSSYVNLTLKYYATDEETGEAVLKEIPLEDFVPDDRDETFDYASGSQEYDFNLATCKIGFNGNEYDIPNCQSTRTGGLMLLGAFIPPADNEKLVYNRYWLHIESHSPIGYDEDEIEFYYVPATLVQTGADEDNGDPIVDVDFDKDVAKLALEIYDKDGNKLNDEPIIVKNEDEELSYGKETLTLPLGSYGVPSGDYYVKIIAYDEAGEPLDSPYDTFKIVYEKPESPAVPDTGRFLSSLGISRTDYIITGVLAFGLIALVGLMILGKKQKKDYRKNLRNRR